MNSETDINYSKELRVKRRHETLTRKKKEADLRIAYLFECSFSKGQHPYTISPRILDDFSIRINEEGRAVVQPINSVYHSIVFDEVMLLGPNEIHMFRTMLEHVEMIQVKLKTRGRGRVKGKIKWKPSNAPESPFRVVRVFSINEIHFDTIPLTIEDPFIARNEYSFEKVVAKYPLDE